MADTLSARTNPGDALSKLRKIVFRILYGFATCLMVFGLLLAITPTNDHTLDLYVFGTSSGTFVLATLIGVLGPKSADRWHPSMPTYGLILFQLVVCLWLAWDSLTHLHRL